MLVFEERGKPECPEKPLSEQRRVKPTTNDSIRVTKNGNTKFRPVELDPYMASTPGFEPGPHWWEASALTTAPPLLSEGNFDKFLTNLVKMKYRVTFVSSYERYHSKEI